MNFFIQMKESVIDTKFYRQIKDNSFGRSFAYLLILGLIAYCMYATIMFLGMQGMIDDLASQLSSSIPDFKLANGEFTFAGKSPFIINGGSDEVFIIDTTGKTNEAALQSATIGILITKDSVYAKQKADIRRLDLRETKGITLTKADVAAFLPRLKTILLIVMAFGFLAALGWKLLNALLLAIIGLMINESIKTDLKFSHIFNFSIYALTLPILLELAVFLSGFRFPLFFVIYWFISIAYVIMAIKGYKDESGSNKRQENQDMFMV